MSEKGNCTQCRFTYTWEGNVKLKQTKCPLHGTTLQRVRPGSGMPIIKTGRRLIACGFRPAGSDLVPMQGMSAELEGIKKAQGAESLGFVPD